MNMFKRVSQFWLVLLILGVTIISVQGQVYLPKILSTTGESRPIANRSPRILETNAAKFQRNVRSQAFFRSSRPPVRPDVVAKKLATSATSPWAESKKDTVELVVEEEVVDERQQKTSVNKENRIFPRSSWNSREYRDIMDIYRGDGSKIQTLQNLWVRIRDAHNNATAPLEGQTVSPKEMKTKKEDEAESNQVHPYYTEVRRQLLLYLRLMPGSQPPGITPLTRGIVICGGGKYISQSWVNIRLLREVGCTLPIELWIMQGEQPSMHLMNRLKGLGVVVRSIETVAPDSDEYITPYALKVFALIFSAFSEILYLDADNHAVRDPTFLFGEPVYQRSGALFWPDYWHVLSSKHKHMAQVVGQQITDQFGKRTFESGQFLVNKRSSWRALMIAAHMNLRGPEVYFSLVSDIGSGDKDLLPLAWLTVHNQRIPMAYPSLGSAGTRSKVDKSGVSHFMGHTMVHYDPQGQVLFLHRNLEKWTACVNQIPRFFNATRRTWTFVQWSSDPEEQPAIQHGITFAKTKGVQTQPFAHKVNFDVEKLCHGYLMELQKLAKDKLFDLPANCISSTQDQNRYGRRTIRDRLNKGSSGQSRGMQGVSDQHLANQAAVRYNLGEVVARKDIYALKHIQGSNRNLNDQNGFPDIEPQ